MNSKNGHVSVRWASGDSVAQRTNVRLELRAPTSNYPTFVGGYAPEGVEHTLLIAWPQMTDMAKETSEIKVELREKSGAVIRSVDLESDLIIRADKTISSALEYLEEMESVFNKKCRYVEDIYPKIELD